MAEFEWDDFSGRLLYHDVCLLVEDNIFCVSRGALSHWSPVFAAMFYSEFQESKQEQITLPDKKGQEILEMLRALFPTKGILKPVDYGNAVVLSKLADEYEIMYLERQCDEFLDRMTSNDLGVVKVFVDASNAGLKKIVRECLPLVARIELTKIYQDLSNAPAEARCAILLQMFGRPKMQCTCGRPVPAACRCIYDLAVTELEKIGL